MKKSLWITDHFYLGICQSFKLLDIILTHLTVFVEGKG